MAPANSDKHPKMQAMVEDCEDVDLADEVQAKESKLPDREASRKDAPAPGAPSSGAEIASSGTAGTTTSQAPANPNLDLDQILKELPKPKNMASFQPVLLNCHVCKKPEPSIRAFIRCPFCKVTPYCGKSCKKDDKKEHKKHCARLGNAHPEKTSQNVQAGQERRDAAERMIATGLKLELEKHTPERAMELWIDAFRLWALENNDSTGKCPNAGFKEFLNQLKTREQYWAPWLHENEGRKKCRGLTKDKSSWYYLERPITAKELRERYDSKDYATFLVGMAKVVHGEIAM